MTLPQAASDVLLLHNPRCSKSRATKALLEERGIAFRERAYLAEPLSVAELTELARRLGVPVSDMVRSGEAAYAEHGLGPASEDEDVLKAMAQAPVLMQRPVVVRGDRARVGRPPEAVLELFP